MSEDHDGPEIFQHLFEQFKAPYLATENYMPMHWLGTGLLRRMGVDPFNCARIERTQFGCASRAFERAVVQG